MQGKQKIGYPSAPQPSPLMIWWIEETRKRAKGLPNEIDLNEIIAAQKGVKNKWYSAFIKYPDRFRDLENLENWSELLALRG